MNLREYQRAVVDVCFAAEVGGAALDALGGDASRWRVYRHMVRTRLWSMAKVAYARSHAVLGPALEASHDRFLAAHGPRSPFIRQVVTDFGRFCLDDASLDTSPAMCDLLRFECAKWQLAYAPLGDLPALRELDFEGQAVLNPVFRVERFEHAVNAGAGDEPPRAQPTWLFMYRPDGAGGARWWTVDDFAAALFERLLHHGGSLAEAVPLAAEQSGQAVDQALLERLSSLLALAVERGVLLGCRA